jgi:hypothetical protein
MSSTKRPLHREELQELAGCLVTMAEQILQALDVLDTAPPSAVSPSTDTDTALFARLRDMLSFPVTPLETYWDAGNLIRQMERNKGQAQTSVELSRWTGISERLIRYCVRFAAVVPRGLAVGLSKQGAHWEDVRALCGTEDPVLLQRNLVLFLHGHVTMEQLKQLRQEEREGRST